MTRFLPYLVLTSLLVFGCQREDPKETTSMVEAELAEESYPESIEHNAKDSLDWEGQYQGILPCEDCDGTHVILSVNADESYSLTQRFIGSDKPMAQEEGVFIWDEEGSVIRLPNMRFYVEENTLIPLDESGIPLSAPDSDDYILQKDD